MVDQNKNQNNNTDSDVESPTPYYGKGWDFVGVFSSFEDADSKRKQIKEGYVKIRRRTDGTFTVHTRDVGPGKAVAPTEPKTKRYGV